MSDSKIPYPVVGLAATEEALVFASSSSAQVLDPLDLSRTQSTTIIAPTHPLVRQIAISSDSRYVATIHDDKSLCVFEVKKQDVDGHKDIALDLKSTRFLTKKASDLSFTPDNDILVSDKVGDCYLYPLVPKEDASAEKLKRMDVQADPTLNPEATYLLGHVSVLTSHIFTEDRKHLITADRDEHIRVTRYPDTFVVERYLFGTDGFVSSIHIPLDHPDLLVSGGGEGVLRIWDWKEGRQLGTVDIEEAILPHRSARSTLRKDKRKNKSSRRGDDAFYTVPEGWMLPSGQGICIKRISSLRIGGNIIVTFFSDGAAALHSFVFPADPSSSTSSEVNTIPTGFPVLDYTVVPGTTDQLLLSLDTTFGTVAFNQEPGQKPKKDITLTEEQQVQVKTQWTVVQVKSDGSFTDISSSSSLLPKLESSAIYPESVNQLSQMNLYPNLSLYPRWPGLEEDDDLAGPAPEDGAGAEGSPAPAPFGSKTKKEYTQAEYEAMNLKTLGRLKSQGYDVEAVMKVKRRETKDRRFEAKRRRLEAGQTDPSKEETVEEEEEEGINA